MSDGKLGSGFMRLPVFNGGLQTPDGEDISAQVKEAWDFLAEHAFVM